MSESDTGGRSRIVDEASAVLSSAKQKLGDVAEPIKEKAFEVAAEQKDRGADQIGAASRAIEGAARELDEEMPRIAGYIHDGARSLERVATQVRERNLEDLAGMFGDFARREPVLAFAGCVVAGLAISRFLKSSGPPRAVAAPQSNGDMTW
jgi:hypothetical protein